MNETIVSRRGPRVTLVAVIAWFVCAAPVLGQFDAIPVPEQLGRIEFMIGDWDVEGTFRTPDHIGADRTLWYETRGGGLTRFDGQVWVSYGVGSPVADSVRALMVEPVEPFRYANQLKASWAQDGFLVIVDEGRTSGTTLIHFDTAADEWVSTAFHAPTNGVTRATAEWTGEHPIFQGNATDRRGERTFRTRYEVHGPDHFTVRTDVTFDGGTTWLDDQIVREVRRR